MNNIYIYVCYLILNRLVNEPLYERLIYFPLIFVGSHINHEVHENMDEINDTVSFRKRLKIHFDERNYTNSIQFLNE